MIYLITNQFTQMIQIPFRNIICYILFTFRSKYRSPAVNSANNKLNELSKINRIPNKIPNNNNNLSIEIKKKVNLEGYQIINSNPSNPNLLPNSLKTNVIIGGKTIKKLNDKVKDGNVIIQIENLKKINLINASKVTNEREKPLKLLGNQEVNISLDKSNPHSIKSTKKICIKEKNLSSLEPFQDQQNNYNTEVIKGLEKNDILDILDNIVDKDQISKKINQKKLNSDKILITQNDELIKESHIAKQIPLEIVEKNKTDININEKIDRSEILREIPEIKKKKREINDLKINDKKLEETEDSKIISSRESPQLLKKKSSKKENLENLPKSVINY